MNELLSPLADRVLVEPIPVEKSIGVIRIPDTVQNKSQFGILRDVGPEVKQERVKKWVGHQVMFGKHAGIDVTVDGKSMKMMREADLFATLGPAPVLDEKDPIIPPTKL